MKGIIALDIDGTITKSSHDLDREVSLFFNQLMERGYHLAFITGRTLTFALPLFRDLRGTYYLGVQNGAALFEMPKKKQLFRRYLKREMLAPLEVFFREIKRPLMIESGFENQDICYYRPSDFSREELSYIEYRKKLSLTTWKEVKDFATLPLDAFPVAKYFAEREVAYEIAGGIKERFDLNAIVIKDAFKPGAFLAHINANEASKGKALVAFHRVLGKKLPVIGAGDDYNDLALLLESDVKIVMEDAPDDLKKIADVIAVSEKGLIEAINGRIS